MSKIEDGGAAFPVMPPCDMEGASASGFPFPESGMSLRDWFAGKAMQAALITDTVPGEACDALIEASMRAGRDPVDQIALNAYECADAMLRARVVKA